MKIEDAIELLQAIEASDCEDYEALAIEKACSLAIDALREKQERDSNKQWLNDMDNPFEPIKIESALSSEMMKYNYRKEHDPKAISVLDYTIIAVLAKALEDSLKERD